MYRGKAGAGLGDLAVWWLSEGLCEKIAQLSNAEQEQNAIEEKKENIVREAGISLVAKLSSETLGKQVDHVGRRRCELKWCAAVGSGIVRSRIKESRQKVCASK